MCQCEDLAASKRSFLKYRVDSLYDNEIESDVIFLVGIEPEVWRFPGHKKILSEANPVFRALLEGPLATKEKTIVIEDVESRAFDYLLRYLYGKDVCFQSPSTALSTLYAAHKYLCSELIELCVKYLDENLNVKNILEIFIHARLYEIKENINPFEPSAPTSSDTSGLLTPVHCYPSTPKNNNNNNKYNDNNKNTNSNSSKNIQQCFPSSPISFCSEALVHSCLEFIDRNADQVLNQEGIEDMSAEDLKEIIKRDTLNIKSENVVFLALERWSNRECKRRKLNLNSKNRRLVLGDLIYEIRFPFFTSDEFISGPIQSGLLNQQELSTFSGLISKSKTVSSLPPKWMPYVEKICKKRMYNETYNASPSQITNLTDSKNGKNLKKNYFFTFKKIKNRNGKSVKEASFTKDLKRKTGDEGEKSCSKCFPECLIDVLVCLFD